MTTTEMISLAKEKLGREITEEQAQAYLEGTEKLPDELLEAVSGGNRIVNPKSRFKASKVTPIA